MNSVRFRASHIFIDLEIWKLPARPQGEKKDSFSLCQEMPVHNGT